MYRAVQEKQGPTDTENPGRLKTHPPCTQSLGLHLFRQMMIFPLAAQSRLVLQGPG